MAKLIALTLAAVTALAPAVRAAEQRSTAFGTIPSAVNCGGTSINFDSDTLVVDCANNRVGIGSATPAVKLDVAGGITAIGSIIFDGGTLTFNASKADKDAIFSGDNETNLLFLDASTDRVGIGTNAPAAKLEVEVTDGDGLGVLLDYNDVGGQDALQIDTESLDGQALNIDAINTSGDVVNITNVGLQASGSLVVLQQADGDSAADGLFINYDGSGSGTALLVDHVVSSGPAIVVTSGRVGIGTTAPASPLHIVGELRLSSAAVDGGDYGTLAHDGDDFVLTTNAGDIVLSGGNVGINTTAPGVKLHIFKAASGQSCEGNHNVCIENSGNSGLHILSGTSNIGAVSFGDSGAVRVGEIRYSHASDSMTFITAGSARITIDSSGKVGIGTTNPVQELDVVGDVVVSATLAVGTTTLPTGGLKAQPPAAQTIAEGNTIADDACGTTKDISSAGSVTTDTTNTITAPSDANDGCVMFIQNVGAQNIILDKNALIALPGGGNITLAADDTITCGSDGAKWRCSALGNN